MYMILLGAPGAGKGTQAEVISRELDLAHIASGDLFREAQQKGTKLGKMAKSYMEKGELVPDDITVRMIMERLKAADCDKGCILDGFPRTLTQATALDKALEGVGRKVDKVAYIKVTEQELLRRLSGRWICRTCQTPFHLISSPTRVPGRCDKCGGELYQRPDDTMETARNRLEVYFEQTVPLIDYYANARKLAEINGDQGINEVSKELIEALK